MEMSRGIHNYLTRITAVKCGGYMTMRARPLREPEAAPDPAASAPGVIDPGADERTGPTRTLSRTGWVYGVA
jgi:hypothetical protein